MAKIVLVNGSCGVGSTGKICASIAEEYEQKGWDVKIAYGRVFDVPTQYERFALRIGNIVNVFLHLSYTRFFDKHGLASYFATKKFIRWLDDYKPDLLWLHNIHGYYLNYEMLFAWIKTNHIKVKWTLHDCWAFTGHCAHFSAVGCDKWKDMCGHCIQKGRYPGSYFGDNSKNNFCRKRKAFCNVEDMEIIVPSEWLANLVKKSFLKEYVVKVQYNEVDKNIFKPRESDFRTKYNLENKIILLGVAYIWDTRKGFDDFIKLSGMIDDRFIIFLVGLKKQQIKVLPSNIIGIGRTSNQQELAEIYSAADFFINPSTQETFGMTTVEAISCGTEAIVYSDTACEEIAGMYGGKVVEKGNVDAIYDYIKMRVQH